MNRSHVRKKPFAPSKTERTRQTDYKRFIVKTSVTDCGELADKEVYTLDEKKIRDEEQFDGFYAVATDLEDPVDAIIDINKGRWEIEESFRIMKTEFQARPVFLKKDNRILAHFTTCFIALTVFRYLEKDCNADIHAARSLTVSIPCAFSAYPMPDIYRLIRETTLPMTFTPCSISAPITRS